MCSKTFGFTFVCNNNPNYCFLFFSAIQETVKIIPTKLQPIDSPIKIPLLKSPKALTSFLQKYKYATHSKQPKAINTVPVLSLFITSLAFRFRLKLYSLFLPADKRYADSRTAADKQQRNP